MRFSPPDSNLVFQDVYFPNSIFFIILNAMKGAWKKRRCEVQDIDWSNSDEQY